MCGLHGTQAWRSQPGQGRKSQPRRPVCQVLRSQEAFCPLLASWGTMTPRLMADRMSPRQQASFSTSTTSGNASELLEIPLGDRTSEPAQNSAQELFLPLIVRRLRSRHWVCKHPFTLSSGDSSVKYCLPPLQKKEECWPQASRKWALLSDATCPALASSTLSLCHPKDCKASPVSQKVQTSIQTQARSILGKLRSPTGTGNH